MTFLLVKKVTVGRRANKRMLFSKKPSSSTTTTTTFHVRIIVVLCIGLSVCLPIYHFHYFQLHEILDQRALETCNDAASLSLPPPPCDRSRNHHHHHVSSPSSALITNATTTTTTTTTNTLQKQSASFHESTTTTTTTTTTATASTTTTKTTFPKKVVGASSSSLSTSILTPPTTRKNKHNDQESLRRRDEIIQATLQAMGLRKDNKPQDNNNKNTNIKAPGQLIQLQQNYIQAHAKLRDLNEKFLANSYSSRRKGNTSNNNNSKTKQGQEQTKKNNNNNTKKDHNNQDDDDYNNHHPHKKHENSKEEDQSPPLTTKEQQQQSGTTNNTKPPKILLAILSSIHVKDKEFKWSFRRRQLARNTWLQFDQIKPYMTNHPPGLFVPNSTTTTTTSTITTMMDSIPNRHCTLQDYQAFRTQSERDACEFVYTFLVAGHKKIENHTTNEHGHYTIPRFEEEASSSSSSSIIMDPLAVAMNDTYESDLWFMNVAENDRIGLGWGFMDYITHQEFFRTDFDYLGFTDHDTVMIPTEFWKNHLFRQEHFKPTIQKRTKNIYAGYTSSSLRRIKKGGGGGDMLLPFHAAGGNNKWNQRFVLLSNDEMVQSIVQSNPYKINPNLMPNVPVDVAIANVLYKHNPNQVPLHLRGIQILKQGRTPQSSMGQPLVLFDKYKDTYIPYEDPQEVALVEESNRKNSVLKLRQSSGGGERNKNTPRILVGIFSMDNPDEMERRELIRKTYLSSLGNRICSLQDVMIPNNNNNNKLDKNPNACQMIYTFVIGGNPNGPKELVEYNSSFPLTIHDSALEEAESDLIILNIQENMKEGKSQTWFKYATTVIDNILYFDYIAKADSDTLLIPQIMLDEEINLLPTFPNNMRIYGGGYRIKIPEQKEPHLGPVYMGGFFYFVSPDLARYITSSQCNRTALAVWSEDQSMGNFVHSHPMPIRRILIQNNWYQHPCKELETLKRVWNRVTYRFRQMRLEKRKKQQKALKVAAAAAAETTKDATAEDGPIDDDSMNTEEEEEE